MQRFSLQAFGSLVFVLFRRPLILKGSCQSFLEIELFSIDLFQLVRESREILLQKRSPGACTIKFTSP